MTDRPFITCERLIGTLDDYVSAEMTADDRAEVERHLERCDSCVAYLDSYRRTIQLEKLLTDYDPV
jgi:anti-sigma factor RsiW